MRGGAGAPAPHRGAFALAGIEVLVEREARDAERPGETVEARFDMRWAILVDR